MRSSGDVEHSGESQARETRKVVSCKHCQFERIVDPNDAVGPADLLLHHGRQTGHRLRVETIE